MFEYIKCAICRRLSKSDWNELKKKYYTLSSEQMKILSPLFSLAATEEEEAVIAALSPSMVESLRGLLKKNFEHHLPLLKLFSMLWEGASDNTSEFAKDLSTREKVVNVVASISRYFSSNIANCSAWTT